MLEDLIQFIWRSKTVLNKPLRLSNGMPIEVMNPGLLNSNQGPDFLFAQILMDDVIWKEFRLKLTKFAGFVIFDKDKMKRILKTVL